MAVHPLLLAGALTATLGLVPEAADAQLGRRLRDAAKRAAEREAERMVDEAVTNVIRCAAGDELCIQQAKESGKPVEFVADDGKVIKDAKGQPVADPAVAAKAAVVRPGEGAWANWDFVPGDSVLYADDFSGDKVGDFPRRMELVGGNFEIVEWKGGRYLRSTGPGAIAIPLPRTLPDRFTVEFSATLNFGNHELSLTPVQFLHAYGQRRYRGTRPCWGLDRAGAVADAGVGPEVRARISGERYQESVVPVRVMADGSYMKVYWDDRRVANIPNAVFQRSDTLFLSFEYVSDKHPILIGPVRVAGGGADLYDRLARDGRVATQGILFASGSDRLRPESTPVLQEIVAMLKAHPDLTLLIEGHTDDVGDDTANHALSERRAASVKAWLVESGGVAAGRLESTGLGESRPAVQGPTPEARAQNRRVELVDRRQAG